MFAKHEKAVRFRLQAEMRETKGKDHTKDAAVCENLGYDRKSTE